MLVLTRRLGEEIVIDGGIRITVVAVKGGQVRLGIAAPSSVTILRGELVDRASDETLTECDESVSRTA